VGFAASLPPDHQWTKSREPEVCPCRIRALEGSTLRPDSGANEDIYGKKIDASDIVRKGTVAVPASAQKLVSLLDKHSPRNKSNTKSLK
jgi:hypothetical protein